MYHKGLNPQEAIDEVARIVRETYDAFQALEPQLVELGQAHGLQDTMEFFIRSCKAYCVGQFQWM